MANFETVRNLLQGAVAAYGVWLLVKGCVQFGGGISNHQSTEMRDGGAQIIGGAVVIAAAVIVGSISIG